MMWEDIPDDSIDWNTHGMIKEGSHIQISPRVAGWVVIASHKVSVSADG